MKEKKLEEQINVRLDGKTLKRVTAFSIKNDWTLSKSVRNIIKEYFAKIKTEG